MCRIDGSNVKLAMWDVENKIGNTFIATLHPSKESLTGRPFIGINPTDILCVPDTHVLIVIRSRKPGSKKKKKWVDTSVLVPTACTISALVSQLADGSSVSGVRAKCCNSNAEICWETYPPTEQKKVSQLAWHQGMEILLDTGNGFPEQGNGPPPV